MKSTEVLEIVDRLRYASDLCIETFTATTRIGILGTIARISNPSGRCETTRFSVGDASRHCKVKLVGIIQPGKQSRHKRHEDPTVLALRLARTKKPKQDKWKGH